MQPVGTHLLADLWGIAACDDGAIQKTLTTACVAGGATVVGACFHRFTPHGVTGVVLLAESHLAIHTWPEHDYAALDVFTCGDPAVAEAVLAEVVARLAPARLTTRRVARGAAAPSAVTAGTH